MESKNIIFILIISGILCYAMIPSFKTNVNDLYNSFSNKRNNQSLQATNGDIISNMPNINYLEYSILGKPQKLQEFNCRYDRDCTIYVSSCENTGCVCLPNGECAIHIVVESNERNYTFIG